MNSPLKDKTIWLIGASSGIGEAFAKVAAEHGCRLVLSARREEKLKEVASQCGAVAYFPLDVTDLESLEETAKKIENEIAAIDIVIANAGTHIPTDVKNFNTEEYRKIMEVNYFGVLNTIQSVLPYFLKRQKGHIVAVSSVAGYRGLPRAAAYGASKSALTHFCESLRLDLEPLGVDVSVVSPGFVRTPLTDKNDFKMPFLMEPEDAAKAMFAGVVARKKEIHFPYRFTFLLKLFRIMPFSLYHWLIKKTVK